MEEFLKLDWTPKPEDILNDHYVNEQSLKEDTAAYKILTGSFVNPFADVRQQNTATNKKSEASNTSEKAAKVSNSKNSN